MYHFFFFRNYKFTIFPKLIHFERINVKKMFINQKNTYHLLQINIQIFVSHKKNAYYNNVNRMISVGFDH